jgi:23S rRNA (uracil1939-C5)-methyltransferase
MDIRRGETIEARVEKVVYGGRGLAHLNNVAIFVANTVPGDMIIARIVRTKKNFAEARVLEVREASPHRVIPPCPYSDFCGGCAWQCIEYEKQLEYKHALVMELLNHIGMVTDFTMHPPLASPHIFAYRNKMEFSFSDKKWLLPKERDEKKDNDSFALGLHVPGTFDKIIDIEGCLLQQEVGNKILREAKRYIRESGIPVYGLKTHQGFWRYLMLRHSYFYDEWMVNIITSDKRDAPIQLLASILNAKFKEIATIVNNINTRRGGTAVGEWEKVVTGEGYIKDKIGTLTFEISANSFFQTNTMMAERLCQSVKDFASLTGRETIFDLYSGIGTISLFLASQAAHIIGVDISNAAIADAKRNCQLNGIDNCEFFCGDVKMFLSECKIQPDVVIADPPRVGMQRGVIGRIGRLLPKRIIYISCNPSTLARDIALLKEWYTLKEVQLIDLFPHTYHIESVARLEKI